LWKQRDQLSAMRERWGWDRCDSPGHAGEWGGRVRSDVSAGGHLPVPECICAFSG
jgi:hypothetical protein